MYEVILHNLHSVLGFSEHSPAKILSLVSLSPKNRQFERQRKFNTQEILVKKTQVVFYAGGPIEGGFFFFWRSLGYLGFLRLLGLMLKLVQVSRALHYICFY